MSYHMILADPPWKYRNTKTGGSHTSGAAQKYPTLTVSETRTHPWRKAFTDGARSGRCPTDR